MVNLRCFELATLLAIALASAGAFAQEKLPNGTAYEALEVVGKSVTDLLNLRGYRSEVHTVRTNDGYLLQLVRVINPKLQNGPTKRPVVFNHGLIESATIYLINSRDIVEAKDLSQCHDNIKEIYSSNDTFYRCGPLMMSNFGYDIYLLSMRGTDFSKRHIIKDPKSEDFWNYCLDDFAFSDVPNTIDYVRRLTKANKIGYVGHSQATLAAFALLSNRPEYASVMEPLIMIAPVSYVGHLFSAIVPVIRTVARLTSDISRGWEKNGPFPVNAKKTRKILHDLCELRSNDLVCKIVSELVSGKGEWWFRGYWSQVPYHTSLKVLRHFAQLHKANKAQRYDYGPKKNLIVYNQQTPPEHPLENISSKSIALFYSESDSLATLKDIEQLKARLKVPVKEVRITKENFNHFDLITAPDADNLVFKPMLEIFEAIEVSNGLCSVPPKPHQNYLKSSQEIEDNYRGNKIDAGDFFNEGFNSFD